jgi:hypothetical protein
MQPRQVLHQLDAGFRNSQVNAMVPTAAAGGTVIAGTRGDDEDFPVSACYQQPLQVCHRRCQGDFMDNEELTRDVIEAVFLLCDGRKLAVTIGTTEA